MSATRPAEAATTQQTRRPSPELKRTMPAVLMPMSVVCEMLRTRPLPPARSRLPRHIEGSHPQNARATRAVDLAA
jgi:hypothetical protein